MNTVGRYIFFQVVMSILIVAGIVSVMVMMVDYVEVARTVSTRTSSTALDVLALVLLRAPMLIETTMPFVVLFGVMWAMFRLNRRSELVVMRASGVSAWRFIAPAAFAAALVGVATTTIYNPTASRLNEQFQAAEQQLLSGSDPTANMNVSSRGLWFREARADGHFIIRARGSQEGGAQLSGVTIYDFEIATEGAPIFQRRIDAETAILRGGFWELARARETGPSLAPIDHERLSIPTSLDTAEISEKVAEPRTVGFWELRARAQALAQAGFNPTPYLLRWWELCVVTISLVAMAIVASATSLRLNRRGGALMLALVGVVLGFGVYFANSVTSALALTGALPPWAAAAAAPTAALLAGLYVISILEDG